MLFIALALLTGSCLNDEIEIFGSGPDLYETNHGTSDFFSRFHYADGKVASVEYRGNDGAWQHTYLTIHYEDRSSQKIRSVAYMPSWPNFQRVDTLYYLSDLLSLIVRTTIDSGSTVKDTTYFSYDQHGNLIEAKLGRKKLEFLNYVDDNFGLMRHYINGQLFAELPIKHDTSRSPFDKLGYLNLVMFRDNYLQGLDYLTKNNVLSWTCTEYQGTTLVESRLMGIEYDSEKRPIHVTTTRVGDAEFEQDTFFKYR